MSARYQQLLGHKPKVENVERELDRCFLWVYYGKAMNRAKHIHRDRERDIQEIEAESNNAYRRLAQIESSISNSKTRQKEIDEEIKGKSLHQPVKHADVFALFSSGEKDHTYPWRAHKPPKCT